MDYVSMPIFHVTVTRQNANNEDERIQIVLPAIRTIIEAAGALQDDIAVFTRHEGYNHYGRDDALTILGADFALMAKYYAVALLTEPLTDLHATVTTLERAYASRLTDGKSLEEWFGYGFKATKEVQEDCGTLSMTMFQKGYPDLNMVYQEGYVPTRSPREILLSWHVQKHLPAKCADREKSRLAILNFREVIHMSCLSRERQRKKIKGIENGTPKTFFLCTAEAKKHDIMVLGSSAGAWRSFPAIENIWIQAFRTRVQSTLFSQMQYVTALQKEEKARLKNKENKFYVEVKSQWDQVQKDRAKGLPNPGKLQRYTKAVIKQHNLEVRRELVATKKNFFEDRRQHLGQAFNEYLEPKECCFLCKIKYSYEECWINPDSESSITALMAPLLKNRQHKPCTCAEDAVSERE